MSERVKKNEAERCGPPKTNRIELDSTQTREEEEREEKALTIGSICVRNAHEKRYSPIVTRSQRR